MRNYLIIIAIFTASLAFGNIKLCGGDLPKALIRQNGFDLCSLYVRVGATIDTGLNINGTLYFYGVPFVPAGPDSFYFLPSTTTSAAGWVYCSDTVRIDTTTAIFPDTIYFAWIADSAHHADSAAWPDSAQVLAWLGQLPAPDTVMFAWSCDTCDSARVAAFADSARIAATAVFSDSATASARATNADTAAWADSLIGGIPSDGDSTYTVVRVTDTADSTLWIKGKWGFARSGNILYGDADSTHVNLGVACTTGQSGQNRKYNAVLSGYGNKASSGTNIYPATVAGGYINKALYECAFVGGGYNNNATTSSSTIAGGYTNTVNGAYGAICGGNTNTENGFYGAICGGEINTINSKVYDGFIGGGSSNVVGLTSGSTFYGTSVLGGWHNVATGGYSAILGGRYNRARELYTFAWGGSSIQADSNSARGVHSLVAGGWHNAAGNAAADTLSSVYQSFYSYVTGKKSHVFCSDSSYVTALNSAIWGGSNDTLSTDSTYQIAGKGMKVKLGATGTPFKSLVVRGDTLIIYTPTDSLKILRD